MMNFNESIRYVELLWRANSKIKPCLLGHTGLGKTELFKQLAKKHGMDLIILHVSQLEPSDFVGLYKINEDGRTDNCPPSWLPYKGEGRVLELNKDKGQSLADILPQGKGFINPNGGIVFLDEVNRGHEDIRQAMYQFLQDGKVHTYTLPEGDLDENGAFVLNEQGFIKGKYYIVTAANPVSEGYEGYEFDPALVNRLGWVQFRPEFEETKSYLQDKYGRNPVISWVDSNKDLIDMGDEFAIEGLLYSPRNVEEHIKLFEAAKKEPVKFLRKVLETIMQKEKVQSFMSYLEEIQFINYKDVMNGLNGQKQKKLEQLLKEQRMDILSTITMDLADFFSRYEFGVTKSDLVEDEKAAEIKVTDFLLAVPDELCTAFIDGLGKIYDNPKAIVYQAYFRKNMKAKLSKYAHLFKA
jgi:hypothetical protein